MFTILWILILAIFLGIGINWLINNNGQVVIDWFGYQVICDALTVFLAMVFLVIFIFIFSYFLAKILSFKFPNIFKVFFKKSYIQRLESISKRQNKAFDEIEKILSCLDFNDVRNAKRSLKNLRSYTKNKKINDYLSIKISKAAGDSSFTKVVKKVKGFSLIPFFKSK